VLLVVGEDGQVRLWNAKTFDAKPPINLGTRVLTSGAFSPDGRRFATGGWDGAVRVWETDGPSELVVLRGQLSRVLDVSFADTADRVSSAGDDGTARVFDAGGITTFTGPAITYSIDLSPSGKWFATGSRDGAVRLWDPVTGRLQRTEPGSEGYTSADFSPAADELVVTREHKAAVQLWSLASSHPKPVSELEKGNHRVVARFDRDGGRLVYTQQDRADSIAVHDLQTDRVVRLGGSPELLYEARISPDGTEVAGSTEGGELLLWHLDHPAAPYRRLRGHTGSINSFDYSRDGLIATAGADRTVRVWNPHTGRHVTLLGHTDEVYNATFTADGTRVVSSGADGTVRLWDRRGGEALAILYAGSDPIYDLVVAKDGRIATVDGHEVVRIVSCSVCGTVQALRARARALSPRPLTAEERSRYLALAG
jgi:WD40 repeat protein